MGTESKPREKFNIFLVFSQQGKREGSGEKQKTEKIVLSGCFRVVDNKICKKWMEKDMILLMLNTYIYIFALKV